MAVDFVVLAAGSGSRLWPITEEYPKPLARVLGKPLLGWILDAIAPAARKIVVVVGTKHEMVHDYVASTPHAGKIVFAHQEKRLGTGHALLQASSLLDDGFVTINGDCFASKEFYSLLAEKAKKKESFIMGKRVADGSRYGVISEKDGLFQRIFEKPENARNCLINTGTYFVPTEFKQFLEKLELSPRGEYEVTDALNAFAEKNDLRVAEFGDYWDDVGGYWNLIDANLYAASKCESKILGEVSANAELSGNVFVGEGAQVQAGCVIQGSAWIGKNAVIGPNSVIRGGAVIEENCKIGASEVSASVILRGAKAQHFNYVGDSVVCEEVNLGGGTKLANLRFDEAPITVDVNGKKIATNRRKLGSAIGARTKTGVNVTVDCGVLVGTDCTIYPGAVVKENLPSGTELKWPKAT